MITRETKAGLVVSASFLCLVAVVVASKMRGPDDGELAMAHNSTSEREMVLPEEPRPSESPSMMIPVQAHAEESPASMPEGTADSHTYSETDLAHDQSHVPVTSPAAAEPMLEHPSEPLALGSEPVMPTPNLEVTPPASKTEMEIADNVPEGKHGPVGSEHDGGLTQPSTPSEAPAHTEVPVLAGAPDLSGPTDPVPAPASEHAVPRVEPELRAEATPKSEARPEPRPSDLAPPPLPSEYVVPPPSTGQPRVVGADGFSGVPVAQAREPEPRPTPGVNLMQPVSDPSQPGVAPNRPRVSPPVADDAPEGSTMLAQATPTQDPYRPMPPVGAPSTIGSPPIPIPLPPGGTPAIPSTPQVDAYDELTHRCKAGDTFESISTQHFHSEKFAHALLMFNRGHPRCADGVRMEPPKLDEGTLVFVPPLRILEKNYASLIPDHTPVAKPIPSAPVAAPVHPVTQPRPSSPPVAVPAPPTLHPAPLKPQPAPISGGQSAVPVGDAKLYRVRANGEMFLEIAKHTLGNGNRWTEIYQMNQRFNPEYRVPAGTVLRLPMDARIDPADLAQ